MNIVTWNMQGSSHKVDNKWNNCVLNMMSNLSLGACCLQECGAVPPSAKLISANFNEVNGLQYFTWGTSRTQKHILYYQSDPAGNRCNLAIVSKTAPLSGVVIYPSIPPIWRPALGFEIAPNTYVFSLHAISPGGTDTVKLLDSINITSGVWGDWTVLGDYNREPSSILVPYVICPPNSSTFSVSKPHASYDFCIKKAGLTTTGVVQKMFYSDHYPVFYII